MRRRRGAELRSACDSHEAKGLGGVLPKDKKDRPAFCVAVGMCATTTPPDVRPRSPGYRWLTLACVCRVPRLNRRSLTNLLRNKMLFAARIGQTVFLGSSSFPIRSSAPSAFPVGCFEHDRFAHACQNVLCWSVRR